MAGYRALAAVGLSVVALLNRRFLEEELPAGVQAPPTALLVGAGGFTMTTSETDTPAVLVFCYRLSVDRETRAGWSAVASADGLPRIPLRMHLLISARDGSAQRELEWLGMTVRALESDSILMRPLLDPIGRWEPADAVQVVPDELALDTMSETFQALTTDYRLCLPYLARVIRIDGRREDVADPVASVVAGVGGGS